MKLIKKLHDTEDLGEWVIQYNDLIILVTFGVFTNVLQEAKQRIHPVDLAYDEPAIVEYYILFTDDVWMYNLREEEVTHKLTLTSKSDQEITKWLYQQKVG